ncbi:MAG TPA: winged helix-turn-helix transcriptional regulator [Candidatus Atribacteria bacterium]|nr:winged helix-turn-helix transcriptional regulator [Candidatus Atribacteria bacterium]
MESGCRVPAEEYIEKISSMVGSLVRVHLIDGRIIMGRLISVDPDYLNLILEEVSGSEREETITVIPGTSIGYIKFIKIKSTIEDNIEDKVLNLLEREPKLTVKEIAKILNVEPKEVRKVIRKLKSKGLIKGRSDTSGRVGRTKP